MATIDNLSIQVTASAGSAASALDRLASSAGGLRGAATRAGGGLRDLSAGAKDAGTATQQAGQQAGNAEKHTRNYGRAAEEAGKAAKRGTAGISDFWQALKRVAYYRFIRTIIKAITSSFREGITNIYKYSNAINGHFAKSLDSLATSTLYLKNSLGSLAAPIIEALTPALNTVINLLVEAINFFSMFIAAISGKSSYTAAVKAATTATAEWGSSTSSSARKAKDDVEKLKRSILGFDEINKLDKAVTGTDGGSGGGGGGSGGPSPSAMFEERPLEGFFKDLSELTSGWPDWLKWLFGIGTVAIGAWGISQLPKLIGAIWDALKNLFSIVIPDWFRWLFGPKGDGDVDIDIPDHIDIPDGKIKVDVEKGDWSALDDIDDKTVSVGLKKDGWTSLADWIDSKWYGYYTVKLQKLDSDWTSLASWIDSKWYGYYTVKLQKLDSDWTSLADWISKSWVGYYTVKLQRLDSDWTSLANWISPKWEGYYTVKLQKLDSDWTSLPDWISKKWEGYYTVKLQKLDSDWTSLADWISNKWEGYYTVKLQKLQSDWTSLASWIDSKWYGFYTVKLQKLNSDWTSLADWISDTWEGTFKVKVELDYSGTDGFGGATGGGGSTSGGGAGRTIKMTVEPETTVGGKTFWERAKEAIDAAGGAVDKGLDVIVRPALNSAGEKITSIVKWLFGNDNTPDVTTKVNGTAGTGFSGVNGNTFTLGGIAGSSVTVNGTPGAGFTGQLSGTNKYTLAGIEDANAKVNVSTGYANGTDKNSVLNLFSWASNVLAGVGFGEKTDNNSVLGLFKWGQSVSAEKPNYADKDVKQNSVLSLFSWSKNVKALKPQYAKEVKKNSVTKLFTWGKKVIAYGADRSEKTGDDAITKLFKWGATVFASGASKGGLSQSAIVNLFTWAQTITVTAIEIAKSALDKLKEKIKSAIDSATSKAGAATGGVIQNGRLTRFESGGIINNSFVRKLPHYAGGSTDAHGTLFVAGEAGPEILGHIGGRTEILNQSQLAQTMFAAVRSAMTGVKIGGYIENVVQSDNDEADYEMMYRAMYDAFTDAMAGSNERDREKVALMRQIAAKEFTAEVTANSVNRAQTRMNRRAGTTIVPVGT